MSRAVVIANGTIDNYEYYGNFFDSTDYVICADGAIRHCIGMNIVPDLWIGDFDSCNCEKICADYPVFNGVERISLNVRKDETDTHRSCIEAQRRGYNEIVLLGASGSRLDHTLSNIHLLEFLHKRGITASIVNEKNTIHIFCGHIRLKDCRENISLIPLDKSIMVKKTIGLEYALENFLLDRCISMGVSNKLIAREAEIYTDNGYMLVVESDD